MSFRPSGYGRVTTTAPARSGCLQASSGLQNVGQTALDDGRVGARGLVEVAHRGAEGLLLDDVMGRGAGDECVDAAISGQHIGQRARLWCQAALIEDRENLQHAPGGFLAAFSRRVRRDLRDLRPDPRRSGQRIQQRDDLVGPGGIPLQQRLLQVIQCGVRCRRLEDLLDQHLDAGRAVLRGQRGDRGHAEVAIERIAGISEAVDQIGVQPLQRAEGTARAEPGEPVV